MNRPTNITVAAALTFSVAMLLALGSCAFFLVGAMVATGDQNGAPVSVAISGMALAGGFLLLILAVAAASLAMNIEELREWARAIPFRKIAASTGQRLRSAFAALAAVRRSWLAELTTSHKNRRIAHHP